MMMMMMMMRRRNDTKYTVAIMYLCITKRYLRNEWGVLNELLLMSCTWSFTGVLDLLIYNRAWQTFQIKDAEAAAPHPLPITRRPPLPARNIYCVYSIHTRC